MGSVAAFEAAVPLVGLPERRLPPLRSAPAGFLRASELGVSAMRTCVFAGHAGPLGAKLGGVTKASFLVRAPAALPPTPSRSGIDSQAPC
jgi:hypothetical protein